MTKNVQVNRLGFVVFAKNKRKVSAFYEKTLNLDLIEQDSSHYLLQGSNIELVIHGISRAYSAKIKISNPPESRDHGVVKPAFFVDDLDAVRAAAAETGGYLKPESTAWIIRGSRVIDGWVSE